MSQRDWEGAASSRSYPPSTKASGPKDKRRAGMTKPS